MCDLMLQIDIQIMKDRFKKPTYAGAAAIIGFFAVYGMVFAKQVCCSDISNTCAPASKPISVNYSINSVCKPSPIHHYSSEPSTKFYTNGLGDRETCCETNCVEPYGQIAYFCPSFKYNATAFYKEVCLVGTSKIGSNIYETSDLPIFPKSAPIYILTQSILC